MTNYKYYTQNGNQYTLKVQKVFITIMTLIVLGVAVMLFTINPNKTNNLIGLAFVAFAALIYLRTTASTVIDKGAKQIIVKPFSFSKPTTYEFKDYDGINNLSISNNGLKGTSTVGLRFIVNGKEKEVKLLQTFMSTKGLHEVVKETESIMNLSQ